MMCFVARYAVWAAVALCAGSAFAEGVLTPAAGSTGGSITVQEEDGSPAVSGATTLKFSNGTVTDNGSGSVSVSVTGGGAPTGATYITQTADAGLSAEQALGALSTGCLGSTTTTGVVAARTITGTANQVSVANGDCSGNPTISIPTNPTLPGTTTGTFSGNLTGNVTGNASTATALAANGSNCSAGQAPLGVNASGAAETCTDYQEEPGSNGLVAKTAANTSAARTLTGTANEITVTNGDGVSGNPTISLPSSIDLGGKSLEIPNGTSLPGTCTVGQQFMDTDATTGQRLYLCESVNTWVLQGDGGGGGAIGGSTGATDNAVLRANGTGGSTLQASGCTLSDTDALTCPGGFVAGTSGAGLLTMLEGTVVSAGTNAGEHNVGFDSSDSRLKSRENAGSLLTYAITADKLSAFAATTSAELRGVLTDESGSGVAVFAGGDVGAATATTPSANDNDTSVATTAYVQTELTAYASDTVTLTNKTLDAEGTGNVLTIPRRLWFPAAGCNNATAGSVWDLPTSNPAVAACKTGTNTQLGVLDFADGSNLSAQITYMLPTTWTGAVDAKIKWLTSATSGSVVWQLSTICVADAETDDPSFNTASTVTDAAKGTTLQTNDASITGVTATGCAAGELLHLKIQRDSAHASDTLAATARLIGVGLVIRETM
jgi:hypothetical protein